MKEGFSFKPDRDAKKNELPKLQSDWEEIPGGRGIQRAATNKRELPEVTEENSQFDLVDGGIVRRSPGGVAAMEKTHLSKDIKPIVEAAQRMFKENSVTREGVEDLISKTSKVVTEQAAKRTEGIRDAIQTKELTGEQRKALGNAILNIAPLAVAAMSPAAERAHDFEDDTSVELVGSNEQVAGSESQPLRIVLDRITGSQQESVEEIIEEPSLLDAEVERRVAWLQSKERSEGYLSTLFANANESAQNGSSESRIEYLLNNISFNDNVPPAAQQVFREIIVGQIGLESGYRQDAVSPAQAYGYGQFTLDTWAELGGGDIKDYTLHVEYLGEFLSRLYNRVQYHMDHEYVGQDEEGNAIFEDDAQGAEVLRTLENDVFAGSPDEFAKFMAYSTVVSYNTGDRRWATAVKLYFRDNAENLSEDVSAENLFHSIVRYAYYSREDLLSGFGPDGLNYVTKARAHSIALQQMAGIEEQGGEQNVRVAYNNF